MNHSGGNGLTIGLLARELGLPPAGSGRTLAEGGRTRVVRVGADGVSSGRGSEIQLNRDVESLANAIQLQQAEDAPQTVERLLKAYLAHRASSDETFLSFARRHDGETLRRLADAEVSS